MAHPQPRTSCVVLRCCYCLCCCTCLYLIGRVNTRMHSITQRYPSLSAQHRVVQLPVVTAIFLVLLLLPAAGIYGMSAECVDIHCLHTHARGRIISHHRIKIETVRREIRGGARPLPHYPGLVLQNRQHNRPLYRLGQPPAIPCRHRIFFHEYSHGVRESPLIPVCAFLKDLRKCIPGMRFFYATCIELIFSRVQAAIYL